MHTARRHLAALTAALMGCGPTTVNITTTGEGEAGEESSTTEMPSGSTGTSGASTEPVPMDTAADTGSDSSGTNGGSSAGGGSSSSSGGSPPPACSLVDANRDDVADACACDGALADLTYCGCPEPGAQDCVCAGAPCGPCVPIGALCSCGGFVVPAEYCN